MTQTFAVAQYVGPVPGQKDPETTGGVPTAAAQVLPAFGASPDSLAAGETHQSPNVVTTPAVASTVPSFDAVSGDHDNNANNHADNNNNDSSSGGTTTPAASNTATVTTTTITRVERPGTTTTTTLPTDIQERLRRMKQNRRGRQVVAAATGAVVGLFVLGPIGAAALGIAAHTATKYGGRARENRIRRRYANPPTATATRVGYSA
eukprot:CAMPEP_0116850194 /NCGR_PEP_ID=MMETSP0418-20121206/16020_1 /TAXON_ID=1158023 /ORGANISM="Astrosyne radiata, Strain 13vi08-1A" /LENGTH=205 /DNA_ID=CAMNT_0004482055 /DNA_START=24 /DNA_END=641 /DNA_ORIENTATION=+